MKKSLLALAILGSFSSIASAQTSIVMYGSIDAAVRRETDNSNGTTRIRMRDASNYTTNRFGFRGTEDLGGGANAHFVLEQGFVSGTGAVTISGLAFERLAFVGVTTKYGILDFGRMYGPQFYSAASYDPMETRFTGITPVTRNSIAGSANSPSNATSNSRTDNAIQYTTKFGDLVVRAMYAFGETAFGPSSGSTQAIGAVYQTPALILGAAYTKKKLIADQMLIPGTNISLFGNDLIPPATASKASYQDADYYTLGGAYTLGKFKGFLGFADEKRDTSTVQHEERNVWTGLKYNITPTFSLTGAYFKTDMSSARGKSDKDLFIISSVYALSKRTALFAEIDHARYDGPEVPVLAAGQFAPASIPGAAIRKGSMVGISHAF
ncbi:MAG: porin [Pseudomonadota bacterium]